MVLLDKRLLKLQKKNKIEVFEDYYDLDFLKHCDEAFLTGTAVEITPVSSIDKFKFEKREMTKFLIDEFHKEIKNY